MSDTILQYKSMLDASGFASGAQKINSQLGEMGIRTQAASANLGGIGTVLGSMASPLTLAALGITAVGSALVSSVQSAAAWETAMTGVAKTSGLSGEALSGLSSGLLDLSTKMPVAADQLASVAAAAGSLGVGQNLADMGDFAGQAEAIQGFTEVAIKMGVGFEMAADQAATAGAKILNSFGQAMDTSNLEKLGSVVNTMGDSFAATEPQVLDFLNRASFLNTTMGQTIPQVAALGTTLISAGMDSEVAATGIKSFLNMATSETSKKGGMDNWAKLMGTSVDELKTKIGSDLNGTLIETANKIAAIEDPVQRFQTAVALAGTEGAPALLKLAGQQENYTKALGMTNDQWENANSLQKTYEAQAASVNSQWQIFTNTISLAATELGTVLLPIVADCLESLTTMAKLGIEAGEGIYEGLSSIGSTVSDAFASSDAWLADTFGFPTGEAAAEDIAEGIESNTDTVAASIEEATGGADALAAVASSGADTGDEWVKNFGDAAEKGMTLVNGTWTSQAAAVADKITEQTVYLGEEEAILQRISTTQGAYYKLLDASTGEIKEASGYMRYSNFLQTPEAWALDLGYSTTKMTGASDVYLDFAKNLETEMESAGKEIGDALTEGIVPDTDTIQSSIDSLKTLQLYDPEEFSEQGGENALTYLNAVQDAINKYEAAKIEYQMDPDNNNAEKNLKTTRDNLQTILDANPLSVEVETKKWGEFDTKSLSELIYDPEELKKSVVDVDRFWEGTMLPDIKSKAESAKEAWESGQVTQDDIYNSLIAPLEALDEYTPDSIEALNELFKTGKIDITEYADALNSLSSAADSVSKSVSDTSEMIAGLYYGTSGTSTSWMDYVNSEGGYTGPTKYYGGYADWKADEASTAQEINEKYGITTVGSISMEIEADASPAKSESDTLISEIETSDPTMTVLMDTTVADARFQNLYNLIVNSNPVVTVQLDFAMDDIRAIIESEVRAALK